MIMGWMMPAENPCITRPRIIVSKVGPNPQIKLPKQNNNIAKVKAIRWPTLAINQLLSSRLVTVVAMNAVDRY